MKKLLIGLLVLGSISSFASQELGNKKVISPVNCELRITNNLSDSEWIWAAGHFTNMVGQLRNIIDNKGYRIVYDKTRTNVAMTLDLTNLKVTRTPLGGFAKGEFNLSGEVSISKSKKFIYGPLARNGKLFERYLNWVLRKMPVCK